MAKNSTTDDVAEVLAALPGWPRFEDKNREKSARTSSRFFHTFRTQPIVLPIWLWNLLMIGLLIALGSVLLYLVLGLLGIALIFLVH